MRQPCEDRALTSMRLGHCGAYAWTCRSACLHTRSAACCLAAHSRALPCTRDDTLSRRSSAPPARPSHSTCSLRLHNRSAAHRAPSHPSHSSVASTCQPTTLGFSHRRAPQLGHSSLEHKPPGCLGEAVHPIVQSSLGLNVLSLGGYGPPD